MSSAIYFFVKGGDILFTDFRQYIKKRLKAENTTYSQLANKIGVAESTIKCFMCRDDSRRIAEKIADALDVSLEYTENKYIVVERE